MILTNNAIEEFEEQVASFFRRASSKSEGEAALQAHASQLQDALPNLLSTIKESPAYAGMAFYGRFQATNIKLIKKLNLEGVASAKAIDAIRTAKALKVSASAKKGWDYLIKTDLDALWSAIRLNLCRTAPPKPSEDDEPDEDEIDEHQEPNEDDN
jgi:hypothetical protein